MLDMLIDFAAGLSVLLACLAAALFGAYAMMRMFFSPKTETYIDEHCRIPVEEDGGEE